jgi:voltage-gated potassium channel
MLAVTWARLLKTMIDGIAEDPRFRALVGATGTLVLIGTLYYVVSQDWSLVDSFYFTISTLTTVGYGDLAPSGDGAKLATVALQLSGIGLFVLLLGEVAKRSMTNRDTGPAGPDGESRSEE